MARAVFLDRDGVINEEKDGSYIFNRDEFVFYKGALDALVALSRKFDYVFIVTNQRGIGRGLMTHEALAEIHSHLREEVVQAGGRISGIYYAAALDRNHSHRKPNTGMAMDAKLDFPDIDFEQSVMVGNNLSDMQFGKAMGMRTVFLYTTQEKLELPHDLIDEQYDSLATWSKHVKGE